MTQKEKAHFVNLTLAILRLLDGDMPNYDIERKRVKESLDAMRADDWHRIHHP